MSVLGRHNSQDIVHIIEIMEHWVGRVALVTGASAGIGAAICKSLVNSGLKVIGAARRVERIEALSKEFAGLPGSLIPFKCDLSKDEEVLYLFKEIKSKFGGVDICINNAGMATSGNLFDGTPEQWRKMLDINVVSLCLCTRESIASMRERGVDDGHIIHISSIAAHVVIPVRVSHFYTATKHAVKALTEGLRQELRASKSHIRVTSISPGIVETEFSEVMSGDPNHAKLVYSSLKTLQPEDIASSVVHALSAPSHMEINDIVIRPTEQDF